MRSPPSPSRSTTSEVPTARVIAAGPDARRTLAPGGRGRVAHLVTGGAYVSVEPDRWLFLSDPRTPLGPLSLRLDRPLALRHNLPVQVTADTLLVGDVRIAVHAPAADDTPITAGAIAFPMATLRHVFRYPTDLSEGVRAVCSGDPEAAVAFLAGRGTGLTAAGDDVLAGWATWRIATGLPPLGLTARAAGRGSPIGVAYLRCAERGELAEPVARFVTAIVRGEPSAVTRAAIGLAGWGASSGSAVAWGMMAAAGVAPAAASPLLSRG